MNHHIDRVPRVGSRFSTGTASRLLTIIPTPQITANTATTYGASVSTAGPRSSADATNSPSQARVAVAKMTTAEYSDRTLTTADVSVSAVVASGR